MLLSIYDGSVAKTSEMLGCILAVGSLSVFQPNILGSQKSLQQSPSDCAVAGRLTTVIHAPQRKTLATV